MRKLFFLLSFLLPFSSAYADESSDALALLQKMHLASQKNTYSGTFVLQQDNKIFSSSIAHRYDDGDEWEKVARLDGRAREYTRHNEDIVSYQPDSKSIRTEKRQQQDDFPAVLAFNGANLSEHYSFKLAEIARIAGNDCRVIIVEPKDALRFGYRFCAALQNNLMLQTQTTDLSNKVLEQISFSSVNFGAVDENLLKTSYQNTKDWKAVKGAVTVSTSSGWAVKKLPTGFKKIREVRRLISYHFEPNSKDKFAFHEVLQLVFSDGLATVSVFIEPVNEDQHNAVNQQGATTIFSRKQGDFWVTIVGEVPMTSIKLISDSIEYKAK